MSVMVTVIVAGADSNCLAVGKVLRRKYINNHDSTSTKYSKVVMKHKVEVRSVMTTETKVEVMSN